MDSLSEYIKHINQSIINLYDEGDQVFHMERIVEINFTATYYDIGNEKYRNILEKSHKLNSFLLSSDSFLISSNKSISNKYFKLLEDYLYTEIREIALENLYEHEKDVIFDLIAKFLLKEDFIPASSIFNFYNLNFEDSKDFFKTLVESKKISWLKWLKLKIKKGSRFFTKRNFIMALINNKVDAAKWISISSKESINDRSSKKSIKLESYDIDYIKERTNDKNVLNYINITPILKPLEQCDQDKDGEYRDPLYGDILTKDNVFTFYQNNKKFCYEKDQLYIWAIHYKNYDNPMNRERLDDSTLRRLKNSVDLSKIELPEPSNEEELDIEDIVNDDEFLDEVESQYLPPGQYEFEVDSNSYNSSDDDSDEDDSYDIQLDPNNLEDRIYGQLLNEHRNIHNGIIHNGIIHNGIIHNGSNNRVNNQDDNYIKYIRLAQVVEKFINTDIDQEFTFYDRLDREVIIDFNHNKIFIGNDDVINYNSIADSDSYIHLFKDHYVVNMAKFLANQRFLDDGPVIQKDYSNPMYNNRYFDIRKAINDDTHFIIELDDVGVIKEFDYDETILPLEQFFNGEDY